MKAAIRTTYGPPEVLSIKDVEKPTPKHNEVLIRVHASTANRSDYHVLTGKPWFMRLYTGLPKPRLATTGTDFAGQVEAAGPGVKSFNVGDRVMGFGGVFGVGAHAQYITFPEDKGIVTIPSNLTYQQAAACLEGAYYASTPITRLKPRAGQKALVYGATGAIGTSYVQFLKYLNLNVTAVCKRENFELATSLGAVKVIDYQTEDFTKDHERYDFIFDAVGKVSFAKCKNLLTPKGIFVSSGGGLDYIFASLITPLTSGKKAMFIVPKDIPGGLLFIRDLIEKGAFRPVIDRVYPLNKISEAFRYVATGEKIGNVVITMDD